MARGLSLVLTFFAEAALDCTELWEEKEVFMNPINPIASFGSSTLGGIFL